MLVKANWKLNTSGHSKSYDNLNSDPSNTTYPGRTNDGEVSAYVGMPIWGEMYTGNDLNTTYWHINRWQSSSVHASHVYIRGNTSGDAASAPWFAARPVMVLKSNVKIDGGEGTMTNPYTLSI